MHLDLDKNKIKKGLYIVTTPIGNLGDITLRALNILKKSDYILCEDTRITKKILNYYKINSKLILNHKFNEKSNIEHITKLLSEDYIISLISDAGTPVISDPGNILIKECIKKNINIVPIPGVSAVTAAISISGFSENFYFHGFVADKKAQIDKEFSYLSKINSCIIFFISPNKLNKIIPSIKEFFPSRKMVICREITKFYEEFIRLDINQIDIFPKKFKGEITVVISEKEKEKKNSSSMNESDKYIIEKLINKISVKDICNILHKGSKIKKSIIYEYCLNLKNEKK